MTRPTCHASFALAAGLLVAASAGVRGDEYRDDERHFSVQLPAGWERSSDDVVKQMNAAVRNLQLAGQFRYDAGFQRKGQLPGAFPYVLVQSVKRRMAGLTYDDVERGLALEFNAASVREVKGKLGDIVRDLSFGTPVLDREHNRVVVTLETDALLAGRAQGLSAGMLGSDGIVFLHCYASKADFQKSLPTFNAMIDSFRYDPGYEFKPSSGEIWERVASGAREGAVVGAVGGLLAALVVGIVRRMKPATKRPAEQPRDAE